MKLIAITRADGGLSLMRIIGDALAADEIEKWKTTAPGQYISHIEVDEENLPQDRAFRDAWMLTGDQVQIDMERAREIAKQCVRQRRRELFPDWDVEWMKAQESGDAARMAAVAAVRQTLRDATDVSRLTAAADPDALKAAALAVITELPDAMEQADAAEAADAVSATL